MTNCTITEGPTAEDVPLGNKVRSRSGAVTCVVGMSVDGDGVVYVVTQAEPWMQCITMPLHVFMRQFRPASHEDVVKQGTISPLTDGDQPWKPSNGGSE